MNMKVGLIQEQSLKLTMTKELQQAITLLQYSTVDLVSYLQEVTLENPLIDFIDKSSTTVFYHNKGNHTEEKENWIENVSKKGTSLHEYLRSQLCGLHFSPIERNAIEILIDAVDRNGYMKEDLSSLSIQFHVPEEVLEKQLHVLQTLDPVGVGARDLQECLLLQLQHRNDEMTSLAYNVVKEFFHPFAQKAWKEIVKETGLTLHQVQAIHDYIQCLNPRPGIQFEEEAPTYIVPDLIIEEKQGQWMVYYNDEFLPQIRMNASYEPLMGTGSDTEIKSYVVNKMQQCKWLVKSLEQRKDTLLRVMKEIIRRQPDFFVLKNHVLKPLTLKDIADELNIHESTVSRAVKDKYVQTPFGLYELKYFFTNRVASSDSDDTSAANVKKVIQQLVDNENKKKPLSDQKIADVLKKDYQMTVSRRTVAKYRDQLNIPSSSLRKRYD
ncbi:RNA polymerase factor sigma-54 [Bacillus kexueae]|uniref:RNA polymerase factor sigma-54 n=1 Tax=Aeribacillus kexueae TaxID=2078952 RepID=UPI001FAFC564|nr:RNA polymerase factor sigma-54 [Bacillus kexueae]